MIIFLDLDGVIANWNLALMQELGFCQEQIDWHHENWKNENTANQLGITEAHLWKAIGRNPSFWENIPIYDYAHELFKKLNELGEVHICTSPGQDANAPSGKVKWLRKHNFKIGKNFFITPTKHLLAGEYRVLVDDTQKQVDKFLLHGGKAVLFPALWNNNKAHVENKVEFTVNSIKELYK